MKKQILFLTFLIAAVLAGVNAFGQNTEIDYLDQAPASCPQPAALTNCGVGDPLHPIAGVYYNYEISHTGGATAQVHWFVTNDASVIASEAVAANIDPDGGSGNFILDAEDGVYNVSTQTATDIDIKWKAFDPSNNVILVAFVMDAAGCTNNIEAWKIEPQYSFVLEIAGLEDNGTVHMTDNASECVSPVVSADWDGSQLTMDYGENYIFYLVTAANFIHSWQPTFTVDASGTLSVVTSSANVEWAYADQANIDGTSTYWHSASDPVEAAHYSNAVNDAIGSDGACIVLRLLVDHGNNPIESGTSETVVVNVDGDMYNPEANSGSGGFDGKYPDLDDAASSGDPCVVGSNDQATYELTPRPTITEVNPAPTSFVTKN